MSQLLPLSLRQRDQLFIILALLAVVALSWVYLFRLSSDMQGMSMNMNAGVHAWTSIDFLLMFIMWAVMMVAMMVPSAMRSVLIYSKIVSQEKQQQKSIAPSFIFALAYIVIWTLFSLLATSVQWVMEMLALLSPMMVVTSSKLGAGLLIVAGIYQLTPLKNACLKHCQSPLMFLAKHYQKGKWTAFKLGFSHGLYCLGCCWMLMCLLFVGGVMNLFWILVISVFVLVEKLLPQKNITTYISSALMILGGLGYLFM